MEFGDSRLDCELAGDVIQQIGQIQAPTCKHLSMNELCNMRIATSEEVLLITPNVDSMYTLTVWAGN